MRTWILLGAVLITGLASLLQRPTPTANAAISFPTIALQQIATGMSDITAVTSAADGTNRLFVLEQPGTIRLLKNGSLQPNLFMNITDRVKIPNLSEQGLLGMAFPPGFAAKQYFYLYYIDKASFITVSRFRVGSNPDAGDPSSEVKLLRIDHTQFTNHDGGALAFGPDGYLYVGTGDGGGAGDPLGNGQATGTLLGKVLRIDSESQAPNGTYSVPPTNPFVGQGAFRPEIWAYGLRNPWRISFDRVTGELFIADVGQDAWEEVNVAPAGKGGQNYGWNRMEGPQCYQAGCSTAGLTQPQIQYPHNATPGYSETGSSLTGGYVYRGPTFSRLRGLYFHGDFGNGKLWAAGRENCVWSTQRLLTTNYQITSFGEDDAGELYVADFNGNVARIVDTRGPSTDIASEIAAVLPPSVAKLNLPAIIAGKGGCG